MKNRSSLFAVGLLAMAALPENSSAQQGVPSRYGYQGETAVRRESPPPPRPATRPQPRPAEAAPAKRPTTAVAAVPKPSKPGTAKKEVAAKTSPEKKAKAPAPEPAKKEVAKQTSSKKDSGKEKDRDVARSTKKAAPATEVASSSKKPAAKSVADRAEKTTRAPSPAPRQREIADTSPRREKPSPTPTVAKSSASRVPVSPKANPAKQPIVMRMLGMNVPLPWTAAEAAEAMDALNSVDLAAAKKDLNDVRTPKPAKAATAPARSKTTPESAPVPGPAPIPKPDARLVLNTAPAPAPAAPSPAEEMPPPPQAVVADTGSLRAAASSDEAAGNRILVSIPRTPGAADDNPFPETMADPALPGPETKTGPEPEPAPVTIAETALPPTAPDPAPPAPSKKKNEEPRMDLLAGDTSMSTSDSESSLVDADSPEPPLPSHEPPPRHREEEAPVTRNVSLESRDKELVRTITTAVKNAKDDPSAAVRSVKSVASQWFDDGKAPKLDRVKDEVKSAVRTIETIGERVPEMALEMSPDMTPRSPEAMPDRMPKFTAPDTGKIDIQSERQADYDQANNRVTFTGKVELNSSALRLRADRVEVTMKKNGGMDVIHATGNVLMRTRDGDAASSGRIASAGTCTYNVTTGQIVLEDWPKIQETGQALISTDPSTRMFIHTDGRLRTEGPNRTIIGR